MLCVSTSGLGTGHVGWGAGAEKIKKDCHASIAADYLTTANCLIVA